MKAPSAQIQATAAIVLALLSGPSAVRGQKAGMTADEILEFSSVLSNETPRWSPDGRWILVAASRPELELDLVPTRGGSPRRAVQNLGGAGHFLARHRPEWSPDGKWAAFISDRGGTVELWAWSATSGELVQLTHLGARIDAFSWSPDSRRLAFSGDRYGGYDVWTVDVPDGHPRRVTSDPGYEVFPAWAPGGTHLYYVRVDSAWMDHDVVDLDLANGSRRVVVRDTNYFDYGAGDAFGFPLVSPDGTTLAFPSFRSGWVNYWSVPTAGGHPKPLAPAHADQSAGEWSPDGRWFAYVENHDGTHDLRVVPADGGAPRVVVSPSSGVTSRLDFSPDGRRLSYVFESPTRVADLHVVDLDGRDTVQLTRSMPVGTLAERLVRPRKITYPGGDSLTITAYLYRPPDLQKGESAPAIVWTHGGPTSQYNDMFQQDAQFFAQHGYVVLLPNIRGSSGYGRRFEDANNGCWGHCDLDDVVAAADFLRRQPYVDSAAIGTTGTSYGGFMTCAAVAFAPGVFQAAVAASGYCNRVAFVHEGEYRHIQQLSYEMGPYRGHEQRYHDVSPYFSIPDIRTPTFIVHGEGRYPGSTQMLDFAREMQRYYKVFRYKAYPGENYYVLSRKNRRQLMSDMLAFFDYYLRGRDGALPGEDHVPERW